MSRSYTDSLALFSLFSSPLFLPSFLQEYVLHSSISAVFVQPLCNNVKIISEQPWPKMCLPFCLGDQVACRKSRAAIRPQLDGCESQRHLPESEAGAPALPDPALHRPTAKDPGHQSQRCGNGVHFHNVAVKGGFYTRMKAK